MSIPYFDEAAVARRIDRKTAFEAVEALFAAIDEGSARNFPVVREQLRDGRIFGVKSGFDMSGGALGLKAGGYWPGNEALGMANHQSTVLLIEAGTGAPRALVAANHLTALRTAAAAAVSIRHLARPHSRVLGLVGAGRQMPFQLHAALDVLAFQEVLGWNRTAGRASALRAAAEARGVAFREADLETVCRHADVLISMTSSREPLIELRWLSPGVHVAAMGADTVGKQELAAQVLRDARVFTDEVGQAITIGECQHAVARGLLSAEDVSPLGRVVSGLEGRNLPDEITVFDGTGVALQDLVLAELMMQPVD